MTGISSIGVGSGLDLQTLLAQLQDAENAPLKDIQDRATSYTTKLTAYGQVQSALTAFKTASDKLADPSFFQTVKSSIGDSDVLGITMNPKAATVPGGASTTAQAGNYNINVTQLAQAQTLVSGGQATTTTAIGSGTIKISFGTITGGTLDPATGQYSGAGFTADPDRASANITIDPNNSSLQGIRDQINKANAGVTASIVNDGSGTPFRLKLTSTTTGEESAMQISATGDAALQNLVGYNPAGAQSMKQTTVGQDALLTVDDIAVRSPTNDVKEAIEGTTLNLTSVGTTSLKLTTDTSSISSAVNAFVKAYNTLLSTSNSLSSYDVDNKKAQPLTGDQTLRSMMTRVRQTLTAPQASGGNSPLNTLTEIGVSFQKDGTLAVDQDKLNAAMANDMAGVTSVFSSGAGSTSGYGKQISALVTDLTSTSGALTAATDGVNKTLDELSDQYNTMQDRANATMDRYRQQFTDLDVLMNSLNNTMTYLKSQFASMNGGNNN